MKNVIFLAVEVKGKEFPFLFLFSSFLSEVKILQGILFLFYYFCIFHLLC